MNAPQRKLFIAVKILAAGMLTALLWHAWQGWGLHRGYPHNTFFFASERRFMDLGDFLRCAALPNPYSDREAFYFPASYFVLGSLTRVNEGMALGLFFFTVFFGLWLPVFFALCSIKFESLRFISPLAFRYFISLGLLLLSYPFLFGMDRANIELLMAALVAMGLLAFKYRYFWLGLLVFFTAVCLKFYPILFIALLLRPRHLGKIWLTVTGALVVTICSLASFDGSLVTNCHLWQQNLVDFKEAYITHNWGMGGSASPWNTIRAFLGTAEYLAAGAPHGSSVIVAGDFIQNLYVLYVLVLLGVVIAVIAYTTLVETEFFRRAVLLLLLVGMIVPVGSDYRLIYANIALIILIILPSQRRHDLLATVLLALALIPKKEIFLVYLGATDSGAYDIPIAVLINPPCLLAAMYFLISDGRKQCSPGYSRQRFFGLVRALTFQRAPTLP